MLDRHAIPPAARAVSFAAAVLAAIASAVFAALAAGCEPRLFTNGKEYVVTLESGVNASERAEFTFDRASNYVFPNCPWENPGFVFGGWREVGSDSAEVYQKDARLTVTRNVSFVAVWKGVLHVVYEKGDADAGEAPVDDTPYLEGARATVQGAKNLQKKNHLLNGWRGVSSAAPVSLLNAYSSGSCEAYRPNAVYHEGEEFILSESVTLSPYWVAVEDALYISYDTNGADAGDDPYDNNPYNEGDWARIVAPGNMTRHKYAFVGWNTKSDGTGKAYSVGASIQINADTVLYAQWKLLYSLSYDTNGASAGDAPTDSRGYADGDWAKAADAPAGMRRDKYAFGSWNTKPDGTGKTYPAGAPVQITADTVLYAQWLEVYSVTYSLNGFDPTGTDTDMLNKNSPAYRPGEIATVTAYSFMDDKTVGKYFAGWNTKADGTGTEYQQNNAFSVWADVTLYAEWKPLSCVWYAQDSDETAEKKLGGMYLPDTQAKLLGSGMAHYPPPVGRYFAGWSLNPSGRNEWYQPGDSFRVTGDVTFYPVWESFVNGPGKGNIEVILVYRGKRLATLTNSLDRGVFLPAVTDFIPAHIPYLDAFDILENWNTSPDGLGLRMNPTERLFHGETLYAIIRKDLSRTFGVSYLVKHKYTDENGKVISLTPADPKQYKTGEKVTAKGLSLPGGTLLFVDGKSGWKFGGWRVWLRTVVNGKEKLSELSPPVIVSEGDTFIMPAGDVVLEDRIV